MSSYLSPQFKYTIFIYTFAIDVLKNQSPSDYSSRLTDLVNKFAALKTLKIKYQASISFISVAVLNIFHILISQSVSNCKTLLIMLFLHNVSYHFISAKRISLVYVWKIVWTLVRYGHEWCFIKFSKLHEAQASTIWELGKHHEWLYITKYTSDHTML